MTIQTQDNKVVYTGNGVAVNFAFNFICFDSNTVFVYINAANEPEQGGYSVTLNTDQDINPGGFVTFDSAPDLDASITIIRIVPLTQEIDYTSYDDFPADTHERGLDNSVLITQQLQEEIDRAYKTPIDSPPGEDFVLPSWDPGAGIAWSETERNVLVNSPYKFEDYQREADRAETAADRANQSALAANLSAAESAESAAASLASEQAAAISEGNAAASAAAALASEQAAAASEGNAASSESAAAASAAAAATSESNAASSEAVAVASANAAADSESNAAQSEANALVSEDLSRRYANEDEGIPVEGQLFSAKHYSIQALRAQGGINLRGPYRGDNDCPKPGDDPGDCTEPDYRNPSQRFPDQTWVNGDAFIISTEGILDLQNELNPFTQELIEINVIVGDYIVYLTEIQDIIVEGWYKLDGIGSGGTSAGLVTFDDTNTFVKGNTVQNFNVALDLRVENMLDMFVGSVQSFAGDPGGIDSLWLLANGQEVSRATYPRLFTKIGTRYGAGDGSTTFNVPDYRGLFPRFQDIGRGTDPDAASRTARPDGTDGDAVGTTQGNQNSAHTHGAAGSHTHNAIADHQHPAAGDHGHAAAGGHTHTADGDHGHTSAGGHQHPAAGNHTHSITDPGHIHTSPHSGGGSTQQPTRSAPGSGATTTINVSNSVTGISIVAAVDHTHPTAGDHTHPNAGSHTHNAIADHTHPNAGSHQHAAAGGHTHSADGEHTHANNGGNESRPVNIYVQAYIFAGQI